MRSAALALTALLAACGDKKEPTAAFRLVLWASPAASREFEVIRERATLKSGETIGLTVERDGSCHVYIVYRDSGGGVFVLTPDADRSAGEPGVEHVLEAPLDDTPGLEYFHVIASEKAIPELEEAIAAYRAGRDDGATLMSIVQRLRAEHEDTTVAAARPVPIGGRLRGQAPEEKATEYDVSGVVCYTFTIDHR